jgi:hypothetical protein
MPYRFQKASVAKSYTISYEETNVQFQFSPLFLTSRLISLGNNHLERIAIELPIT